MASQAMGGDFGPVIHHHLPGCWPLSRPLLRHIQPPRRALWIRRAGYNILYQSWRIWGLGSIRFVSPSHRVLKQECVAGDRRATLATVPSRVSVRDSCEDGNMVFRTWRSS